MAESTDLNPLAELREELLAGNNFGEPLPQTEDELRALLGTAESSHLQFSIWKRLRELGVCATDSESENVLGVVGEVGVDGGSALIFALADGSASMYTSAGGGVLGAGGDAATQAACKRTLEAAKPVFAKLPVSTTFPFPKTNHFRFSILAASGVHVAEVAESDLASGEHELSRLLRAWTHLATNLQLADPRQRRIAMRRAGPKYVNCLLTLMWEQSLPPVTITRGLPVPDLREFAKTPEDDAFIDTIEVPPTEVNAVVAIAHLLYLARLSPLSFFKKSAILKAKLAVSTDRVIEVRFFVEKKRDEENRRCYTVTRQPIEGSTSTSSE